MPQILIHSNRIEIMSNEIGPENISKPPEKMRTFLSRARVGGLFGGAAVLAYGIVTNSLLVETLGIGVGISAGAVTEIAEKRMNRNEEYFLTDETKVEDE